MTEEEKVVEVRKHGECCCKLFCKFLMITASVFTGTLLALLVAKALTQPAFPPCPCAFKGHRPGIERQFPPAQMGERPMHRHHFKGERPDFDKESKPNKPEKKD